ncbi:hypothetical protein PGT21_031440 [Puccinia graminis f. sp. tritici]|uniref:Homeobox domain-containing protein n=1 Tax=Puccinia graminis f. sp. tritici TaxID=56615 RepID=A0A5B0NPV1_PUCGR|nr:hypothetical protein PGTUg99_032128 [Puccinia graminis f. sp. tritici]KAA1091331.1 hypothetical protein PGT21_031440 [Puccinia graminis f. sp. tritici]
MIDLQSATLPLFQSLTQHYYQQQQQEEDEAGTSQLIYSLLNGHHQPRADSPASSSSSSSENRHSSSPHLSSSSSSSLPIRTKSTARQKPKPFNPWQTKILLSILNYDQHLSSVEKDMVGLTLGLSSTQINRWFCNARARELKRSKKFNELDQIKPPIETFSPSISSRLTTQPAEEEEGAEAGRAGNQLKQKERVEAESAAHIDPRLFEGLITTTTHSATPPAVAQEQPIQPPSSFNQHLNLQDILSQLNRPQPPTTNQPIPSSSSSSSASSEGEDDHTVRTPTMTSTTTTTTTNPPKHQETLLSFFSSPPPPSLQDLDFDQLFASLQQHHHHPQEEVPSASINSSPLPQPQVDHSGLNQDSLWPPLMAPSSDTPDSPSPAGLESQTPPPPPPAWIQAPVINDNNDVQNLSTDHPSVFDLLLSQLCLPPPLPAHQSFPSSSSHPLHQPSFIPPFCLPTEGSEQSTFNQPPSHS